MAIKGRQTLYSIFVNGAIPTQNDYRDLVDSALNRRDDRFFGEWQKGMKYCEGDVVIFGKALYKLLKTEEESPCPLPDGEGSSEDEEDACYCSITEPPLDAKHWCTLELKLKDKDWEIVLEPEGDPNGRVTTIYQPTAQVGIGTNNPKALLDISNQNKILLEPAETGNPEISLEKRYVNEAEESVIQQYAKYRLSENVYWETDALAYVFKLVGKVSDEGSLTEGNIPKDEPAPILLMKITATTDGTAQLGVGANDPKGGLHVLRKDRGQVLLNPGNHQEPGILIVNLQEEGNGHYALVGLNGEYVFQSTNAAGGFRFKKDETNEEDMMSCESVVGGNTLMAILGDGRVGIGTEDPKSYVEITDAASGAIRFQFGNDEKNISNPALSINNLRPNIQQPNTYLTLGADDDYGIIVSDAPSGIVVKKGGAFGTNENEVNINQGQTVFFITPEGKVGVQTSNPPTYYDLDVLGQIRSLTAYLETNSTTIVKTTDLRDDNVLEKLDKLHPTRFTYIKDIDQATTPKPEHIGFMAQNVFEHFPELVRKIGPDEKAIAYGNMTAVLVQAIQDQQKLIKEMEDRICALEEKLGNDA